MDNEKELADSQTAEETQPVINELDSDDSDLDISDTPVISEEDLENLKQRLTKAESSAQKWKERASFKSKSGEDTDDLRRVVKKLEHSDKKREFQFKHNLSPEETDYVFRFAGKDDLVKTLEHPFVKAGLEAIRTQKRVEAATPSSSSTSRTIDGKSWAELKPEERAKNFDKFASSFKK